MIRFQVIRREVYYKGKRYIIGDFLPENFSDRDRIRHLYPSRIAAVTIPDPILPESKDLPVVPDEEKSDEIIVEQKSVNSSKKGDEPAEVHPKPAMAPLSGTRRLTPLTPLKH